MNLQQRETNLGNANAGQSAREARNEVSREGRAAAVHRQELGHVGGSARVRFLGGAHDGQQRRRRQREARDAEPAHRR